MPPPLYIAIVPTNATAQTSGQDTTAISLWGGFDTLIIDIGGQTTPAPTCTVTLATVAGGGTGAARTILSAKEVTADVSFPIRDLATTQAGADITGADVYIPLVGDKLILSVYGSSSTNTTLTPQTLKAYLILK